MAANPYLSQKKNVITTANTLYIHIHTQHTHI